MLTLTRPTRWRIRRLSILVASIALVAACTSSSGAERHADGEGGPLSASTGGGTSSLFAPGDMTWYGSFGSMLLCARTPGQKITLRDVAFDAEVEPLDVTPYLRIVGPDEVEGDGNARDTIGTAVGEPPNLYGGERLPGTFTTEIAGHEISHSCDELGPDSGYTELIIVMKNDERGGYLLGVSITYTAGGDDYILDTDWNMVGCGSAIPLVDGENVCA